MRSENIVDSNRVRSKSSRKRIDTAGPHRTWFCGQCGASGFVDIQTIPGPCPKCGQTTVSAVSGIGRSWPTKDRRKTASPEEVAELLAKAGREIDQDNPHIRYRVRYLEAPNDAERRAVLRAYIAEYPERDKRSRWLQERLDDYGIVDTARRGQPRESRSPKAVENQQPSDRDLTMAKRKIADPAKYPNMIAREVAAYLGISRQSVYEHPGLEKVSTGIRRYIWTTLSVKAVRDLQPS